MNSIVFRAVRGSAAVFSIFICVGLSINAARAGEMQVYKSEDLPDLPYSAAVRAGDMVYVSGVTGHRPGSAEPVEGGIDAEADQAFAYVKQTLERVGSSLDKTVKCTVLLADIDHFPALNKAFTRYFPENPPARSTIVVPALPHDSQIEVECDALAD